MVSLYRDPEGKNVFSGSLHSDSSGGSTKKGSSSVVSTSHEINSVVVLRARVKELEEQLETNGIVPAKVWLSLHVSIVCMTWYACHCA